MDITKRAVLFANGEAANPNSLELHADDFRVAIDGGLRQLQALQLAPHLLIGDMDSLFLNEVEDCAHAGAEVLRFPPAKDKTDLELALDEVLHRGFQEIMIVSALGGRLDQTLGNLALLARPDLKNVQVHLDDGANEVYLLHRGINLPCQPGDTVSLLPWGKPAECIYTSGLEYPLAGETLFPWQTRGISNHCLDTKFGVTLERGALMLIHTRQNQQKEK